MKRRAICSLIVAMILGFGIRANANQVNTMGQWQLQVTNGPILITGVLTLNQVGDTVPRLTAQWWLTPKWTQNSTVRVELAGLPSTLLQMGRVFRASGATMARSPVVSSSASGSHQRSRVRLRPNTMGYSKVLQHR